MQWKNIYHNLSTVELNIKHCRYTQAKSTVELHKAAIAYNSLPNIMLCTNVLLYRSYVWNLHCFLLHIFFIFSCMINVFVSHDAYILPLYEYLVFHHNVWRNFPLILSTCHLFILVVIKLFVSNHSIVLPYYLQSNVLFANLIFRHEHIRRKDWSY